MYYILLYEISVIETKSQFMIILKLSPDVVLVND